MMQQNSGKLIQLQQQQLKGILNSLNEDDLVHTFNMFVAYSDISAEKSCKMISYKCYESAYVYNGKKANGYGRNEKEANVNCIRNLLEFLLEDDGFASAFRECLKQVSIDDSITKSEEGNSQNHTSSIPIKKTSSQTGNNNNNSVGCASSGVAAIGGSSSTTVATATTTFGAAAAAVNSSVQITSTIRSSLDSYSHERTPSAGIAAYKPTINNLNHQMNLNFPSSTQSVSAAAVRTSSQSQHQQSTSQQSVGQRLNTDTTSNHSRHSTHHPSLANPNNSKQNEQYKCNNSMSHLDNMSNILNNSGSHFMSTDHANQSRQQSQQQSTSQQLQSQQQQQQQQHQSRARQINFQGNSGISTTASCELNELKKINEKDLRFQAMEDELHKSKSYIDHLERKIKLVQEENKILKSLLVENKKGGLISNKQQQSQHSQLQGQQHHHPHNQSQQVQQQHPHLNSIHNTTSINQTISSSSNLHQHHQHSHSQHQTSISKHQNSENIPPASAGGNNYSAQKRSGATTAQNAYLYVPGSIQNASQNAASKKKPAQTMPTVPMEASQSLVLRDHSNKANIISGGSHNINNQSQAKQAIVMGGNLISQNFEDEDLPAKPVIDKFRSLSVDVNGRGQTISALNYNAYDDDSQNSIKKLDSSFSVGCSSVGGSSLLGHRKYKSKIPKLNLEVLPNFHGKSNKSINDQLLVAFQANHQSCSTINSFNNKLSN